MFGPVTGVCSLKLFHAAATIALISAKACLWHNILLTAIGLFPTAIMADQLPSNAEEYAFAYQCMLHQEMVKLAGVPESHVLASECLACV